MKETQDVQNYRETGVSASAATLSRQDTANPTHSEVRDGTDSGDDPSSLVPYGGRNPRLTAEVQGQAMAYFA